MEEDMGRSGNARRITTGWTFRPRSSKKTHPHWRTILYRTTFTNRCKGLLKRLGAGPADKTTRAPPCGEPDQKEIRGKDHGLSALAIRLRRKDSAEGTAIRRRNQTRWAPRVYVSELPLASIILALASTKLSGWWSDFGP